MSVTVELPRTGLPGGGLGGPWRVGGLNYEPQKLDHVGGEAARGGSRADARRWLPDRGQDPQQWVRDRLERPARGRRELLGATGRRGPDHGPTRSRLGEAG